MDPFLGEIRMFGGNFAPKGWASCDGQLLSISQNTALFSLLGTQFGGNGTSNFALPNFQGSVPVGQGNGPGLTPRVMGENGGSPTVTLLTSEMPGHNHQANCDNTNNGTAPNPSGAIWAKTPGDRSHPGISVYTNATPSTPMNPQALSVVGSSFPHNNQSPYLCLFFIIALQGIFPARG